MANILTQILQTALQGISDAGEQARAAGNALLATEEAGLVQLPTLIKTVAQVCVGEQSPSALVPVMAAEQQTLLNLIDGPMQRFVPRVRDNGVIYSWTDAKKDPGALVWYLAAAVRAAPQEAASALEGALQFGFSLDAPAQYGQDPITILVLITAIVGLAAGIIALVNTISSALRKPAVTTTTGGSITKTVTPPPDTGASAPSGDSGFMIVAALGIAYFVFFDKPKKSAAAA